MELAQTPRRFIYLALALSAAVIAVTVLNHKLTQTPLGKSAKADLPMLDVIVKLRDVDGKDIDPGSSKIADDGEAPAGDERCHALIGGDSRETTTWSISDKRPADCPNVATWYVKQRPIALSVYVEDGKRLIEWYDHHPQVQEWVASRFTQGLMYGFLHSLKIRSEDLNLQGLQGAFLAALLRDALGAEAQFHYDIVHGHQGWVMSFVRADSSYAAKAIPVMIHELARNGYRIRKLPEPVFEMRVGTQKLFMTQQDGRVYLAQGLEALLNVLDGLTPPEGGVPDAPVSVTLRSEAFLDKFMPAMTGSPRSDFTASFALEDGKLGMLNVPGGRWDKHLRSRIFEGVLASIPFDAFGAVAASLQISPNLTEEDWRKLGTDGPADKPAAGPDESGFALVWDFDGKNSPTGALGIIVANQTEPKATAAYQQYLKNGDLSAECAGGAVFLAATSERLLARMKESCARQSSSPLDWERSSGKDRYKSAQVMAFVNPGTGLRELFLGGGAGLEGDDNQDFSPRWKQDYEKAKAAMRADGDKLFTKLPIFAYAGRSVGGKTITLDGQAVSQGVAP